MTVLEQLQAARFLNLHRPLLKNFEFTYVLGKVCQKVYFEEFEIQTLANVLLLLIFDISLPLVLFLLQDGYC